MRFKSKKKLTRREIKQDKFVVAIYRVTSFVREHVRQMVMAALAVVVILIVWFSIAHHRRETAEKAATLLGKADIEYWGGNYDSAINQYESLIERYGHTESAKLARFYLGNCYFFVGEFDQALKAYRRFLKGYDHDKALSASAMSGIAACYEQMGQYPKAAEQYERCANRYSDLFLAPQFLINAGRCYQTAGEEAEAKYMYQQVIDFYPRSPLARKAESALGRL